MIDPRNQALQEQRERIRNAAHRQSWIAFSVNDGHRVFDFRVWIDLYGTDGAIESNEFRAWVTSLYQLDINSNYLQGSVLSLTNKNTETIADELYEQIAQRYPERSITIEVSANGEYGTSIDYNLTRPNLSIKY